MGRPRFAAFYIPPFMIMHLQKHSNTPSSSSFSLIPLFPPPTPLLDFFCFHRNWVLSHAFFSHGSFLPRWIGFWKCITPSKQAEAASPAAYNI